MELLQTLLQDAFVIQSPAFYDERGGFVKLFNQQSDLLQNYHIKQINFVQNNQKGILRGLHYQTKNFAESKFFRVLKGSIQLAFVDLRNPVLGSENVGTFVLDKPDIGVLIPRGFATGYLTLEDNTDVLYYSDNTYNPLSERGICWNDPFFKIPWLNPTPNLSSKDLGWANFITSK